MNNTEDITALRQERNLLFDFYGPMLTEKQTACFTMRYVEDCSLSEIAQELSISPQGVVDFLNRAVVRLEDCEAKLGLVRKFQEQQTLAIRIMSKLDQLEQEMDLSDAATEKVRWIKAAVNELM